MEGFRDQWAEAPGKHFIVLPVGGIIQFYRDGPWFVVGTAKVFIYRYKQYAGAAWEPSVFCDESQIARMYNGRYFVMTVTLGKHVFRSNDTQSGLELEAVAGKEYYLRVELVPGAWKFHGHLVVVAPEQGTYEVKRLQLLASCSGHQQLLQETKAVLSGNQRPTLTGTHSLNSLRI